MVKKPYGSTYPATFPAWNEGWQPEPPFVRIDDDLMYISPTNAVHQGQSWATFIKGNVNVN